MQTFNKLPKKYQTSQWIPEKRKFPNSIVLRHSKILKLQFICKFYSFHISLYIFIVHGYWIRSEIVGIIVWISEVQENFQKIRSIVKITKILNVPHFSVSIVDFFSRFCKILDFGKIFLVFYGTHESRLSFSFWWCTLGQNPKIGKISFHHLILRQMVC